MNSVYMHIPQWIRERVISLQVISEDLDAETVTEELAEFGDVENVQFIVGRTSGKRHALVTFTDGESAARALDGRSNLPIKPMNPTWFARYKLTDSQQVEILRSLGIPRFLIPYPSTEPTVAVPSSYDEALKKKLEESEHRVNQLLGSSQQLRSNLGEAHKYINLLKEGLEDAKKRLKQEIMHRSEAERILQQKIEEQNQVIQELRVRLTQPPLVSREDSTMQISDNAPSNSGCTDPTEETKYHPEKQENEAVSHLPIPQPYISAVGPSLLEAFRLLDQIITGALSAEALTDGSEGPMRKKRKLGDA